jgi:predicted nicotinamide N-methyase
LVEVGLRADLEVVHQVLVEVLLVVDLEVVHQVLGEDHRPVLEEVRLLALEKVVVEVMEEEEEEVVVAVVVRHSCQLTFPRVPYVSS